jgi:acyl-CoA reductase-like NAD-dependent aldehyde dehydrogenase
MATPPVYQNLIGGKFVDSASGRTFENRNPADTREIIGIFQDSDERDVQAAVEAAKRAYRHWRLVPAPKRGEILFKAAQLLVERKEQYARDMTREMGKVLKETRGDVQEAIDMCFFMAGEGRRLYGQTTPSEMPNKFQMSVRQPLGVCGLITPWNFPMAIPSWKILPALIVGNTVVIKPASDTPLSVYNLVQCLLDAGIPDGVVNIVTGSGSRVGEPLIRHPDVQVISFTGSTEIGSKVARVGAEGMKHVSLEMGGKNPMIVMDDANLDLVVDGAIWGAFGTTGQRCTATSRLIAHRAIVGELTERLADRAERLKIGNGLDETVEMGPAINRSQLETVQRYVEIGKSEGARLVVGGQALRDGAYALRVLPPANDLCRCAAHHAHRPGRDFRSGAVDHHRRQPGRGDRRRQRRALRSFVRHLHPRRECRLPCHARSLHRHCVCECADDWRGDPSAVRRHKGYRQRSPRRRHSGARRFQRVEIDLHRFFGNASAGADRHLPDGDG